MMSCNLNLNVLDHRLCRRVSKHTLKFKVCRLFRKLQTQVFSNDLKQHRMSQPSLLIAHTKLTSVHARLCTTTRCRIAGAVVARIAAFRASASATNTGSLQGNPVVFTKMSAEVSVTGGGEGLGEGTIGDVDG